MKTEPLLCTYCKRPVKEDRREYWSCAPCSVGGAFKHDYQFRLFKFTYKRFKQFAGLPCFNGNGDKALQWLMMHYSKEDLKELLDIHGAGECMRKGVLVIPDNRFTRRWRDNHDE